MFLATRDEYGEYAAMFGAPMPTIEDAWDSVNCNPSGKGFVGQYVKYVTHYLDHIRPESQRKVVAITLGDSPLTAGSAIAVLWLIEPDENPIEIARVYQIV